MPSMYGGKETIAGKTVVVTGANTGIGKETVRDLAMRGEHPIINIPQSETKRCLIACSIHVAKTRD